LQTKKGRKHLSKLLKNKIKRKDEIRELVTKAIDSEAVEDYSKAEEEDVKENSPQSSDDEENISEDENIACSFYIS